MINTKVKVINNSSSYHFQEDVNKFLETIDTRQIVKSEFSTSATTHTTHFSVMIYYVPFEDIRDAKIDNILEIK